MSETNTIAERRAKLSAAKLELLEKLRRGEFTLERPVIPCRPTSDFIPLSFAQERMWFINQLIPDSPAYNTITAIRLTGELDVVALERSVNEIVRRHETLRTIFPSIDGKPSQVIHPSLTVHLPLVDLKEYPASEREAQALQLVDEEEQYLFDLAHGPTWRVILLRLSERDHIFQFTVHHIISDGWSSWVFNYELSVFYKAFLTGHPSPLPELPIQYADYAVWQRDWLQGERLTTQLAYWEKKFSNSPLIVELPGDRPRPAIQNLRGARQSFELSLSLSKALKALSQQEGTTLFMTLLAAFKVLLYRYTGQTDIVIGSPMTNRDRVELEGLIGFFVNTLLLRTDLSGNPSFRTLLARVRETTLGAYANPDLPFEQLVETLQPERDLSRNPLFQIMFVLQNNPHPVVELPQLTFDLIETRKSVALFDLWLGMQEWEDRLLGGIEYSTDLFDATTMARMLKHFQSLLESIASNPDQRLSDLALLTEEERQDLFITWNNTYRDYPKDSLLHQLFEAQAQQTPDTIALVFEEQHLTYAELNTRANQLARHLQRFGVRPDAVVAVCLERSVEMVLGLLGTLKAGGAYLPINPKDPPDKVLAMLEDSQASVLLTHSHCVQGIPFTRLQQLHDVRPQLVLTAPRPQIQNLDALPFPDRSLVNYHKYNQYVGQGCVQYVMSLMATRGCPYQCVYCHKIWPKRQVARSAQSVFDEIKLHYDRGYRTFNILDDIFNLDRRNSESFFELVIKNNLKIRILFPSGLRGDILTPDYIDLMSEAGVSLVALALETAAPRMQRLIRKNLKIEKLRENLVYICDKHPHIVLELFTMFGFPTETEAEVLMTFDFIKEIKWLHFPYLNSLKIFPGTDMAHLAMEQGIPKEVIERSSHLAYNELSDALPFSKSFARQYQANFMKEYFLLPERLDHVIPYQKRALTREELIAKYNNYLPGGLESYPEIAQRLGRGGFFTLETLPEEDIREETHSRKHKESAATQQSGSPLRVLLIDLSLEFSGEQAHRLYNPIEVPLGLMYLLSYLNREFGSQVQGQILKAMIDFDSFQELQTKIERFQPQFIGLRSLSLYKNFFHEIASLIKQWFPYIPIVAGGPYATSEYETILSDRNVDLVVIGEGEITFAELIGHILKNGGQLPGDDTLTTIAGLAFIPSQERCTRENSGVTREILMLDRIASLINREETSNLARLNQAHDLAYVIYTSGSTGKPKGVMNTHRGICNRLRWMQDTYQLTQVDRVLQKTPFTFDVSVWEFFWPLMTGACLVIARPEGHKDGAYLAHSIAEQKITTLHFVPSMLQVFLEEKGLEACKYLTRVICSGEALPWALQEKFFGRLDAELYNLYGPTEAAIDVTFWACRRDDQQRTVPIGQPIANTYIHLLDKYMNSVPVGVPGELHIGGVGLARGYLYRPELTAEKFIPDPFSQEPGARLYKTGDLARYRPDGNIEFVGRLDYQVKIRGVRVELGEIEATLRQHLYVRDAIVVAREAAHTPGHKQIVAYILPQLPPAGEASRASDTAHAAERILEWQQVFDTAYSEMAASPEPTFNITGWNSSYSGLPLPADEMQVWVDSTAERILAQRPQRVLEIGCGTGLIFFQIAPHCKQYWATDFSSAALHYVQQGLSQCDRKLLQIKLLRREANDFSGLQAGAFDAVILNSVIQYFPSVEYLLHVLKGALQVVAPGGFIFLGDVRSLPLLEAFHTSIELARCPASLTTTHLQQRVQKQISQEHELVVDPSFFFALLHILPQIGYVQTHLKRGWHHNELTKFRYDVFLYASQPALPKAEACWLDWPKEGTTPTAIAQILRESKPEFLGLRHVPNARLAAELLIQALLAEPHRPEQVGELRHALQETDPINAIEPEDWWALAKEVPYTVEVGWSDGSTSGCYDVMFKRQTATTGDVPLAIWPGNVNKDWPWQSYTNNPLQERLTDQLVPDLRRFLKERLSDYLIPSAFVLLENWSLTPSGKLDRRALPAPFESTTEVNADFVAPRTLIERELVGIWSQVLGLAQVGIHQNFFEIGGDSILSIRVIARANQAGIQLTPQQLFQHPTIAELAAVAGLVSNSQAQPDQLTQPVSTLVNLHPTFSLVEMDRQRLDQLLAHIPDVEDVYPLSPYQEHMLHRLLLKPEPGLFVFQRITFQPMAIDNAIWARAFQQVLARHPILRTSFLWEGLDRPIQIVHRLGKMWLEQQDWRSLSPAEQAEQLEAYAEAARAQGFALTEPIGVRLLIAQVAEDACQMVLTGSYLRGDGWGYQVAFNEINTLYDAFEAGQDLELERPPLYRDFIAWVRQQNLIEAETFWRQTLRGFTTPTPLMSRALGNTPGQEEGFARGHIYLSAQTTADLQALVKQHRLTLNTLIQGAWALLLSRYCGQTDVLFGITVAGRPVDLPKVESIVGPTFATLPLRVQVPRQATLVPWLKGLMAQQMEIGQYAYTPLRKIHEWSQVPEGLPLFESYLVFQNLTRAELRVNSRLTHLAYAQMEHPLRIDAFPQSEMALLMFYYRRYFNANTISHLLLDLQTALERFVVYPEQSLGDLIDF